MTKQEKEMWTINIENVTSIITSKLGSEVANSVFRRFDAHGIHDLNPCYYSEVFGDLELIANDN